MDIECIISSQQIVERLYTGHLVTAIVTVILVVAWLYTRRRVKSKAAVDAVMLSVLVPVILLMIAVNYACWSGDYGITINGTNATIRFYEDKTLTINICNATIKLLDASEARKLLRARVDALADPLGGVYAGYYKPRKGGGRIAVLLLEDTDKALYLEQNSKKALIGLPCIEEYYQEIMRIKEANCQKQLR